MGTKADRFISAAVTAAKRAKEWAIVAARESDRLLKEARTRTESELRRRKLKQTLLKTGRVLKSAGRAALVAAVAAGIAATIAERTAPALPKRRGN